MNRQAERKACLYAVSGAPETCRWHVLSVFLISLLWSLFFPLPARAETMVNEWLLIDRAANDEDITREAEEYFASLSYILKENDGILNKRKYTEYSKAVLTLTLIGKDPSDVGGYDLLSRLEEQENVKKQGVNGPIWALIALDSGSYRSYSRTAYVKEILAKELPAGGWNMEGTGRADPDVTAMALQALCQYTRYGQVQKAIERGVQVLSELQNEEGGYSCYDARNSESVSQVIIALCELGIPVTDGRFVKNGHTVEENLKTFRLEDGTFMHTKEIGKTDGLATEQGTLALREISRQRQKKTPVYQMMRGNAK